MRSSPYRSLEAFAASRARAAPANAANALVGVFNPTEDLPNAEIESALIAPRFRTRSSFAANAQLSDLAPSGAGSTYWHLATHGAFDWIDPRQSGLVLGGERRLRVADLLTLPSTLRLRLVVLSACETGLFDMEDAANEFIGLPAAFLQAGAAGVVASSWPVSDVSTALLMAKFYEFHIDQGRPPSSALRAAQLWLRDATMQEIQSYIGAGELSEEQIDLIVGQLLELPPSDRPFAAPYYWAGFVYYGA